MLYFGLWETYLQKMDPLNLFDKLNQEKYANKFICVCVYIYNYVVIYFLFTLWNCNVVVARILQLHLILYLFSPVSLGIEISFCFKNLSSPM